VHALGRFLTRELERTAFYKEKVPKLVKQLFVFAFVTFAWIFFRAENISDAFTIVQRIFTSGLANPEAPLPIPKGIGTPESFRDCPLLALAFVFSVWFYQLVYESRARWILQTRLVRIGIVIFMVFYLLIFAVSSERPFIYSQF
jgi:hypothetical protein